MEKNKPQTKAELIEQISQLSKIDKKTVKQVLEANESVLLAELKRIGEIKFGVFGKIKISLRPERRGVNPSTKQVVIYPEKSVPKFSFAKAFKEFVLVDCKEPVK